MSDQPEAGLQKADGNGKPAQAEPQPSDGGAPLVAEYVTAEKALAKLDKPEVLSLAAFISSKMTLGPDPESAKIMAETEIHHETCRLDGYKENLKNQDAEGKRRHEFRMKRLGNEFVLTMGVMALCIAGSATGIYLIAKGNSSVGG